MKAVFWVLLAAAGFALATPLAHAARSASVDVEEAELHEGPDKKSKVVEKLGKGMLVTTSNEATEGFYKIRTSTGSVGWVQADALVLMEAGSNGEAVPSMPGSSGGSTNSAMSGFRKHYPNAGMRLRVLGGVNFFNDKDVNDNFGFDELKNGFNYGLELEFVFSADISLVFRMERVQKSFVARDRASLKTFQLDLTSTPVAIGVATGLSRDGNFSTQFVALAGLGIATKLLSTGLNFDPPNETVYQDTPFTVMAKFNLTWKLTKAISFSGEGGYRILKTGQLSQTSRGNGGEIFEPNGIPSPISLDMTGIILGAGLVFNL